MRKIEIGHLFVLLAAIVLMGCESKPRASKPLEQNRSPVFQKPNVYVLAFGSADAQPRNPRGAGSCFRIGDRVYTADHVLRGAGYRDDRPIRIFILTDVMRRTRVVARYPKRDLAILEPVEGMRDLPAGSYDRTQSVTVEGYAPSRGTKLGQGFYYHKFAGQYIAPIAYNYGSYETVYVETSADMLQGMSGGPVMQLGKVVGVQALLSGEYVDRRETHSQNSGFVLLDH